MPYQDEIVKPSSIPLAPYLEPSSPTKALSLSMRLEQICRALGFLGLSAPQIGLPHDLFVYWSNYPSEPKVFSCVLGGGYLGRGDKFLSLESCATFSGERFGVMRYSSVELSGKTIKSDEGKISISTNSIELSGVLAAIVQHECDHIRGISPEVAGERIFIK